MSDSILSAIIGGAGVIIGVFLTWLFSLISDCLNNERENKRTKLAIEIETYADAIRYIGIYSRIKQNEMVRSLGANNEEVLRKLQNEEVVLYNKFHPIFSLIASEDTVKKYNDLRNEIDEGKIDQAGAYEKVIQILDFNISDK